MAEVEAPEPRELAYTGGEGAGEAVVGEAEAEEVEGGEDGGVDGPREAHVLELEAADAAVSAEDGGPIGGVAAAEGRWDGIPV